MACQTAVLTRDGSCSRVHGTECTVRSARYGVHGTGYNTVRSARYGLAHLVVALTRQITMLVHRLVTPFGAVGPCQTDVQVGQHRPPSPEVRWYQDSWPPMQ